MGERTAQFLAEHFGSLDALRDAGEEELLAVEEVGPRIAQSIVEFFAGPKNRELLDSLGKAGLSSLARKRTGNQADRQDLRPHRDPSPPDP